jgi:hypothetical protein
MYKELHMKPKNLKKKHSAAIHNHETIQDAQFHMWWLSGDVVAQLAKATG